VSRLQLTGDKNNTGPILKLPIGGR
jgi:hypothetical protein